SKAKGSERRYEESAGAERGAGGGQFYRGQEKLSQYPGDGPRAGCFSALPCSLAVHARWNCRGVWRLDRQAKSRAAIFVHAAGSFNVQLGECHRLPKTILSNVN